MTSPSSQQQDQATRPSPATSQCGVTPPPSLATSGATSTKSYNLNFLLALATPKAKLPQPALARVNSFSEIRKDSISNWGVDEASSDILHGKPISKSLPIPKQTKLVGEEGQGHPADMLFDYQSTPGDQAVPILIDFTTTDPFNTRPVPIRKASASSVFQGYSGPANSATSTTAVMGESMAFSLGERFSSLRMGSRTPSFSRSTSPASSEAPSLKRSDSITSLSGGLNPFAAPWPLPETTPKVITPSMSPSVCASTKSMFYDDIPSLPLPKVLPSSLPAKPNASLPPVFIKRESAALPQSMTLPDIAPLGPAWEGERAMSGNERRRRASEMVTPPQMMEGGGLMRMGENLGNQPRPARLIRLGQKLKENAGGKLQT